MSLLALVAQMIKGFLNRKGRFGKTHLNCVAVAPKVDIASTLLPPRPKLVH